MKFTVQRGSAVEAKADALVVPVFEETKKLQGAAQAVDAATGGIVGKVLGQDFKGKRGETLVLYPSGLGAQRLVLVGLGKKGEFNAHAARVARACAAKKLRDVKCKTAATVMPGAGVRGVDVATAAQALAEGTTMGLYRFDKYKSYAMNGDGKGDEKPVDLAEVTVLVDEQRQVAQAQRGIEVGVVIAESVNFTRDLVNESGKEGYPASIAERAQMMAKEVGLKCKIYGKAELEKMGFGALLAVNSGSANEARFVVLEHNPGKGDPLVFVGKGITFDSGGISIKPSKDMEKMKYDKSGACAVFGALRAAALLNVPHHVVGLAPLTDNLPSGSSYKPGDVVKAYNGKWIEVVNTDAEGRMVLSDALAYASKHYKPQAVVDLATLTGACGIALGNLYIGIMGTDRGLMGKVKQAGERSHERCWEMPFDEEFDDYFKSDIAIAKNAGTGMAGTVVGGRFLSKFVEGAPWVHLDIASTAWDEGSGRARFNPELGPGSSGTGVGVRLLVQLMQDWKPGKRR